MKSEYISNDILEEAHLKLFSPFRVAQMILGSCRVDARDRFVTSPTKPQKLYTIICILLCTALYVSVGYNFLSRFWPYRNIYYLNLIALLLHYATFVCSIINVRFLNNDENVNFYVKTQEIDRKLKINNNKLINDFIYVTNISTVLLTLGILLSLFFAALTQDAIIVASFVGLLYGQVTCTLEWLYCSNLLMFFYVRLRYINAIITNHIEGTDDIKIENINKVRIPTMKVLRYMASSSHDFNYSETDVYLKQIYDELFRFQNLYRFQILLFCFKFVASTLLAFEYGLLSLQNNILIWLEYIVLPTVTALDLLIVIALSVRCEAFSGEIKKTKYLCTTILSLYYGGPLRQKAIKMLKMIIERPPRFSVYDMWHMDAATMLSMINLVTTLMVTLLQFALF
ncbi:uncharacterized protein LOC112050316 [Bicyclus anynana]|uniref:Gustatory receptor n=1 Tax=Bicyclus anynana TaxID=110368 RepID=A0ABM3LG52_BICAN|nr:uncharacterized protein LOC112050316 [Bicyclus anynana]